MKAGKYYWVSGLLALLLLPGCRNSPTLVQPVYNQTAPEITQEDRMLDNQQDHEEEDDQLSSKKESAEADTTRDQEASNPQVGDNPQTGAEDRQEQLPPDQRGSSTQAVPSQDPNMAPEGEPEAIAGEGGDTSVKAAPDGTGGRQIVTAYGAEVTIPEAVNRVSATGDAALLVQMLGGTQCLTAVSQDFQSNDRIQAAFAREGAAAIPALWSGSGNSPMDGASFEQLLALAPEVCFTVSGQNSFTDAQLAALEEAGIVRVTIPSMASDEGLLEAVRIVGEVLADQSGNGGQNAGEAAARYLQWHDQVLADVSERVQRFTANQVDYNNDGTSNQIKTVSGETAASGMYTLYIESWDETAQYQLYTELGVELSTSGMAVARKGYTESPMDYYLSMGGVDDRAASGAAGSYTVRWYVNPFSSVLHNFSISGTDGIGYDKQVNGTRLTAAGGNGLGDANFPALILSSASLEPKIRASALWQNYGYITNNTKGGYGFLDVNNNIVTSTIHGNYACYVLPTGIKCWSEGSPESVLTSVWAAEKFYGAFTEAELTAYLKQFYSEFMRYDLSDSEAAAILAGQ